MPPVNELICVVLMVQNYKKAPHPFVLDAGPLCDRDEALVWYKYDCRLNIRAGGQAVRLIVKFFSRKLNNWIVCLTAKYMGKENRI